MGCGTEGDTNKLLFRLRVCFVSNPIPPFRNKRKMEIVENPDAAVFYGLRKDYKVAIGVASTILNVMAFDDNEVWFITWDIFAEVLSFLVGLDLSLIDSAVFLVVKGQTWRRYRGFNEVASILLDNGQFLTAYRATDDDTRMLAWDVLQRHRSLGSHPNLVEVHCIHDCACSGCTKRRRVCSTFHPSIVYQESITRFRSLFHVASYFPEARLPLSALRWYTRQIVQALAFLHSHGYAHRKLDFDTVLVALESGTVKLIQFMEDQRSRRETQNVPHTLAPEMLEEKRGDPRPADIWALGCIVGGLFTGLPPWDTKSPLHMMCQLACISTKWPRNLEKAQDTLPVDLREFLTHCLDRDPVGRSTADRLLTLRFLQC